MSESKRQITSYLRKEILAALAEYEQTFTQRTDRNQEYHDGYRDAVAHARQQVLTKLKLVQQYDAHKIKRADSFGDFTGKAR